MSDTTNHDLHFNFEDHTAESNLSVSEAQTSDELSFEELESVAGGWGLNDFKEGVRDGLQGFADGSGGRDDSESNLNYLGGHAAGSLVGTLGDLIKRK